MSCSVEVKIYFNYLVMDAIKYWYKRQKELRKKYFYCVR
jgi:hypothetical protein